MHILLSVSPRFSKQSIFHLCSTHSDETKRERDFYKSRNMPCPKDIPQNHDDDTFNDSHVDSDYHRQDEQVNVCLECKNNINALSRRFIRCSSQATITHLKKFVAKKVLSGMDKYKEVSGFFFSLMFYLGNYDFDKKTKKINLSDFRFHKKRSIYCAMMNFSAKIIHLNSYTSRDGDSKIHRSGYSFALEWICNFNFF